MEELTSKVPRRLEFIAQANVRKYEFSPIFFQKFNTNIIDFVFLCFLLSF